MTDKELSNGVTANAWSRLRQFTDARIGLGRAGISLPTRQLLEFQLAHAQAQDAVHLPLDVNALCQQLATLEGAAALTPIRLHSQAADRITYLQRPDLGRRLDDESAQRLNAPAPDAASAPRQACDLAIVVVDGLSSLAVQNNATAFIETLLEELSLDKDQSWRLGPLTLVEQGRVAIGDEIGERLNARAVLVLIGERPGLSSPDSLGLYLTWGPRLNLNDASRNCISNVRPGGLSYPDAARRLMYLLRESRRQKLSGVALKDRTDDNLIEHQGEARNFLIS
ncbi:MAG: ethanolamine ammonia-lyase subunit EutC [Oleiphilaceae bacterium]|nr:ethanolamine ammonia-lyase subunit EutC [Oleiphilaceae bacterium]